MSLTKIVLGKPPETFKKNVEFQLLDGAIGAIECTFKYRTRSAFSSFLAKFIEGAEEHKTGEQKTEEPRKLAPEKIRQETTDLLAKNAGYLMEILSGWNLDAPFNRESCQQLCDEVPAACNAIVDAYRIAINEGRLGN